MKSVRRPAVALVRHDRPGRDPGGRRPHRAARARRLVGRAAAIRRGLWPLAPYVVFVPVLLAIVWWASIRAGDRFWTLTAGVVLAVLLAQAAACLVMTWDLALAVWAAGFVTAKAVPAALIVAALTRWFGGPTTGSRSRRGSLWPPAVSIWLPAVLFAAVAPLLAGLWWTGAAYAPGVPAARPDRGAVSMIVAVLLIAVATALCLRVDARARPRRAGRVARGARRGRRGGPRPGGRRVRGRRWPERRPVAADDGLRRGRRRPLLRRLRRLDRRRERGRRRPGSRRHDRRGSLQLAAAAVAVVAVERGARPALAPVQPRRRRTAQPPRHPRRRASCAPRARHHRRRRQPGAAARRQREPARRLLPAACPTWRRPGR